MIKLLLLAFLVMLPEQSKAASRKLGTSDQNRVARVVDGSRTSNSQQRKKCETNDDCKTGCDGYRYCDPSGDFICHRGYCSPNKCEVNSNCPDDQFCYEGTTPYSCQDLNCDITTTENYYAGVATIAQFVSNHQCHSCSEWARGSDPCPCEFCTNAGCSQAALGCGIGGDGYTYKIECADDEVMIDGNCLPCSTRVTGCDTCHLNAGNVICTKCSDGSYPIDNLCTNEYVECVANDDCTNDKICEASTHTCVLPPSVKDPTVDCQLFNGEYAHNHTCNLCASDNSCAECFYTNSTNQVICNRCADGFEFNGEDAVSCVPSDCANHGLHSTCGPDTVGVESTTYPGCYTCNDPVSGGQVSCTVGTLHYHSETGKYCCE